MDWLSVKAIFGLSAFFWCFVCTVSTDISKEIEKSLTNQQGWKNIKHSLTLREILSKNYNTFDNSNAYHHRQKRGGSKGKKKSSGGGIWKKISRGIQSFTDHIRRTKEKIVRLINGPTYSKAHRQNKPKGSHLQVNATATATATFEKGKGQISG